MSNAAAQMTAAYFDSKDFKYDLTGDNQDRIITGMGLENKDGIKFLIAFDDSETSVAIRAFDIAKFPQDKMPEMFVLANMLNSKFRWIKFVVDPEDCTISAEDDAVIQLDSCGAEIFELCLRMANIVDDAYPIIMKACFAN